jgi:hypothetical protein
MRARLVLTIVGAVTLGLVVGCAPQVPPDTPDLRMEKARALAALEAGDGAGYERTLDQGASVALDSTLDELVLQLARELTADEQDDVEYVMRDALAGVLTLEEWQQAAAEIYSTHFTPAELDTALRFYSSPVGTKILGLRSTLEQEMSAAVEAIVGQRLEKFINLVDQGLAELFPELDEGVEG